MKNRVFFYSSVKNKRLFFTQKFYQIDVQILKSLGHDVTLTNKILSFFLFWRYDIAYIYFYRFGFFTALIAKIFGKKVIFTGGIDDLDRSYASNRKFFIQKLFFKGCYFLSDRCLIVSNSDFQNIKKIYSQKKLRKLLISFHSIEVDDFLFREGLDQKDNLFTTVAWMGNTENIIRKGLNESLYFFKYITSSFSDFADYKFMIIGKTGEGTDSLIKTCKNLKIESKVIFTGEISEKRKIQIIKTSKYYLQLSKYEGFGLAALEALCAHNIVLHSGVGGLKDSIGNYGIIVDVFNFKENLSDIRLQMISFNQKKFEKSDKYIVENFSIASRKNNIEKSLNEE